MTQKRWFHDIDNLYGAFSVKSDHWVAVDINFKKEMLYVYDSIPSHTTDKQIVVACEFLRRVIPPLLNIMVPRNERLESNNMYGVRRVRANVPLNKNPGDCGGYAIKYVECLALGWTFQGLNDENIMAIRERLAAELFDEVLDTRGPVMTNPLPRGKAFKLPQLNDNSI